MGENMEDGRYKEMLESVFKIEEPGMLFSC